MNKKKHDILPQNENITVEESRISANEGTDLSNRKAAKVQNKRQHKVGKWIKRHKVISTLIAVILIIAIVMGAIFASKAGNSEEAYSFIRTTTLAKGDLQNSISTTGTVASANTSSVSTTLSYSVESVNVAVGDVVKKGDVICTLDTSELENQIEKEKENLSKSAQSAQTSYDTANTAYSTAKSDLSTAKATLSSATSAKSTASEPYNKAKSAVKSYQSSYDSALKAYNSAGAKYVSAKSTYESAVKNYKSGKISATALSTAAKAYMKAVQNFYGGCSVGTYDISDSTSSLSSASNTSSSASASYSSVSNSSVQSGSSSQQSSQGSSSLTAYVSVTAADLCSTVVSTVSSLSGKKLSVPTGSNTLKTLISKAKALQNAKQNCNYDVLYSAYESAKSAYDTADKAYTQAQGEVTQAQSQLSQAKSELENASTSDNLTELQSELGKCSLVAESSGIVTAMNATVGSPCKDTIATIQDTDNLKVNITISEADINNAKVGMSCLITSDATKDTLNGTLTQISPTSDESGAFGAGVVVDSKDSGLLIGMNASVEIVVSSIENVFQVPIDAVGSDDNGSFIYRQTGGTGVDMTFEKVYVKTGEQNDYYIEISSDDLNDGDVVRSSSDLTQGIETSSSQSDTSSGFSLASLFGGGSNSGMKGGMDNNGAKRNNRPSDMPSGSSTGQNASGSGAAPMG